MTLLFSVVVSSKSTFNTSGLFRRSQLNWAALTKEAYAIYMSLKKLSFYLHSAQVTLRSDHLLLKNQADQLPGLLQIKHILVG